MFINDYNSLIKYIGNYPIDL